MAAWERGVGEGLLHLTKGHAGYAHTSGNKHTASFGGGHHSTSYGAGKVLHGSGHGHVGKALVSHTSGYKSHGGIAGNISPKRPQSGYIASNNMASSVVTGGGKVTSGGSMEKYSRSGRYSHGGALSTSQVRKSHGATTTAVKNPRKSYGNTTGGNYTSNYSSSNVVYR